jgi:hypothetical protein
MDLNIDTDTLKPAWCFSFKKKDNVWLTFSNKDFEVQDANFNLFLLFLM